jgi:hypothetical protein
MLVKVEFTNLLLDKKARGGGGLKLHLMVYIALELF